MRALAILLVCCVTPVRAGLLFYDGFEYTAGQLLAPTNDTTGSPNPGQHNVAYNVDWRYNGGGGTNTNPPGITSGSLSVPGQPASTGNSVAFDTSQLASTRIEIPGQPYGGTIYWSGYLRVNSVNNLTTGTNGMLLGGLNNQTGPSTGVSTVGAILRIRQADPTHYYIGTGLSTSTGSGVGGAVVQFDNTNAHSQTETVFVVASYAIVAGATNDIAKMWINPALADFGAAFPPPADLTSAPGSAIADPLSVIASFNLRNVNSVGNAVGIEFDELRIGTDWASVTAPEPGALSLLMIAAGSVLVTSSRVLRRRKVDVQ